LTNEGDVFGAGKNDEGQIGEVSDQEKLGEF
jgi:hypothetical protein